MVFKVEQGVIPQQKQDQFVTKKNNKPKKFETIISTANVVQMSPSQSSAHTSDLDDDDGES